MGVVDLYDSAVPRNVVVNALIHVPYRPRWGLMGSVELLVPSHLASQAEFLIIISCEHLTPSEGNKEKIRTSHSSSRLKHAGRASDRDG